jgi:hypothetical protein
MLTFEPHVESMSLMGGGVALQLLMKDPEQRLRLEDVRAHPWMLRWLGPPDELDA